MTDVSRGQQATKTSESSAKEKKSFMKTSLRLVALSVGVGYALGGFAATKPIAQWSFEDASNIGAPTVGSASLSSAETTGAY